MHTRPHILVVDDEPQITRVLRTSLDAQGYEIRVANDGETALEIVKDFTPDLVITDLAMPHMNGIELCRQLRKISQVPIIVLSVRGRSAARSRHWIPAPTTTSPSRSAAGNCWPAFARRCGARLPCRQRHADLIEQGDFRIDLDAHSGHGGRKEVKLTPKEFDVLVYMAQHPDKVLTHRAILNAVWGSNNVEQNEYLRVFVGQLRKKLELDASSPKYIVTEPWVGYRFEPGE